MNKVKADLIINNIKTLYTSVNKPPVHGKQMSDILELKNAFIAIKDGKVLNTGIGDGFKYKDKNTKIIDAKKKVVIPGFIDSHTHLVHAGSREEEYELLKKGVPYLDILNKGGGILGTVSKTKKATFDELYQKAKNSLNIFLRHGVTVLESKSGYGLDYETEKKQLLVNKKLNDEGIVKIISTHMAAHAIPLEYKDNKKMYIEKMIQDLKKFKKENLFSFVDIFCEDSVFSIAETKHFLTEAKNLGYKVKIHADEIVSLGGAGLGVELKASSVDHLMAISDQDIEKLAYSNTIANLLPGTSFYLKKAYAPARKMIEKGVAISLSSDYNPGSCPTENYQLILQLASNYLNMNYQEILTAATINPAYHLGISEQKGSLEVGKDADFILLDIPNLAYMFYHFGINHTSEVYIKGKLVVNEKGEIKK